MSGGNSVSSSGLESGSNFCRDMDLYKFYKDQATVLNIIKYRLRRILFVGFGIRRQNLNTFKLFWKFER